MLFIFPLFLNAQLAKGKPKNSTSQGTLFGYWGNNRSSYTKSTLFFSGPGYDFSLKGSKASDKPTPFSFKGYFDPTKLTLLQYNVRLGYYFKNHYAISVGYDHLKYVFADQNQVLLSGTINPGVDTVTNWSGTYLNESVITDRNTFHYENSNGLNYLRIEFTRSDQLYKMGKKDWLVVSSNFSAGFGGLLSYNTFVFGGKSDNATLSMSGYAISAHAGLRFEFFQHFFIQSTVSGGFMHQLHVMNRTNEPNAISKQKFGYTAFDTSIGFLLYIRPTNSCNSCPVW